MPATRTISSISPPITQSNLLAGIQAAFSNAGFTSTFDNFTSGTDLISVYAFTVDTGTFGTIYLRVRVSNTLAVFQQLFTGWNTSTKQGTNGSTEVSLGTVLSTVAISFNSFYPQPVNGLTEYRLVMLTQGSLLFPLGLIAPLTRRPSWNLNSFAWGFIFTSNSFATLRGASLVQHSSADYEVSLMGNSRLGTANPIDYERDVLSNLILLSQSNQGYAGRTSDDLAVISANGNSRFDRIPSSGTSREYIIINPASGGFGIRVT